MRWFKPNLRGSIHAIFSLGQPRAVSESVLEISVEDIRISMLEAIDDVDDTQFRHVKRRIRYAIDVMALWYLRGDLMAALASKHGEAEARDRVAVISDMFEDVLPEGLRSRPSPLGTTPKE